MSNTILIKRSSTPDAAPAAESLALGELAINLADGNLFYKNASNQVTVIASNKFVTVSGQISAGGNVVGANINTSGLISATGNVSANNFSAASNIVAAGNITGNFLIANTAIIANVQFTDITTGNITANGFANINGNVTGGNFTTTGITSTGSLTATTTVSAGGNITGANFSTAGLVTAVGNITGGNLVTVGNIDATGNIAGSFFIGNGRFLSGIDTTLISNGNSEVRVYNNSNVAITVGGIANAIWSLPVQPVSQEP
jgi:hypothetical protein